MLGEKKRWWEDGKGAEGVGRTMRKKRTILRDSGQPVGLKSGVVLLQLPSKIRITFQRRNRNVSASPTNKSGPIADDPSDRNEPGLA